VRILCAAAVSGVLALALCRPPVEVDVGSAEEGEDARVCALVDSLLAVAFLGVSPPSDATPEDFRATQRVNAELAQLREQMQSLDVVRELGCGR
jgi:hypothetical protein